jgi:hypothetical protein
MATSPAPEERLAPLILAARILSIALSPLTLACGGVLMMDGHAPMGVLVAAIGVFSSVCLYVLVTGMATLTELARVNRYRRERDEELATLLTDVHRLLVAAGAGSTAEAGQNRSGVFKSSQMPFTPEDDAALTSRRPTKRE